MSLGNTLLKIVENKVDGEYSRKMPLGQFVEDPPKLNDVPIEHLDGKAVVFVEDNENSLEP